MSRLNFRPASTTKNMKNRPRQPGSRPAQGTGEADAKDESWAIRLVPGFMRKAVVEHQRLTFRPADDPVMDAHPDITTTRHAKPEVAGDQRLGRSAPHRAMGRGGQDHK